MPSITYILCPGQGAQTVAMGKDFYAASPAAKETYDAANKILGFDLAKICFEGPVEELDKTNISQPAIYVTSIATYRAAAAAGVISPADKTEFAGLSLGEYTALHLAGVFSFEDGLKLVAARGKYMQGTAVATPSGMVAIVGSDEAAITKMCEESANGEVLVLANYNAPGQIVVSGAKGACERVAAAATAAGLKAVPLPVAGAFHSPIMQSGADKMKAELDHVQFAPPRATVYSNVTASPHRDAASIKKLLVDQIVSPVRWEQTMQQIAPIEGARFIELAPGRALTGMLKKINRRLPVENLGTAESLSAAKA